MKRAAACVVVACRMLWLSPLPARVSQPCMHHLLRHRPCTACTTGVVCGQCTLEMLHILQCVFTGMHQPTCSTFLGDDAGCCVTLHFFLPLCCRVSWCWQGERQTIRCTRAWLRRVLLAGNAAAPHCPARGALQHCIASTRLLLLLLSKAALHDRLISMHCIPDGVPSQSYIPTHFHNALNIAALLPLSYVLQTTLVRYILNERHGFRIAVILNEYGGETGLESAFVQNEQVGWETAQHFRFCLNALGFAGCAALFEGGDSSYE